jgi:hypothetical protein
VQTLPLKVFQAIPGGSVRIPLLIGTASLRPQELKIVADFGDESYILG